MLARALPPNRDGYIGLESKYGTSAREIREIVTSRPQEFAKAIFVAASHRGVTITSYRDARGRDTFVLFFTRDAKITYRPESSSNKSPTIAISDPNPGSIFAPQQKIHIIEVQ